MALKQLFHSLLIASALLAYQADNTARNKRDRDGTAMTAQKQGNSKADVDMVARIRRSVVQDKTLSANAHNVKIVVNEGHVWLRGPVSTEAEKNRVQALAQASAGEKNVINSLEVTKGTK